MSDSESSEDRAATPVIDIEHPDADGGGETLNASRRDVLKGGGLFASSMFGAGELSVPDDLFGRAQGTVPDEPEERGQVRQFSVHAIEVDIVFNRYGLHQPRAATLVLEEDLPEAREASGKVPCDNNLVDLDAPFCEEIPDDERADEVDTRVLQPLTLNANKGDIVEIEFHNHLDRTASIHQTSLPYDVEESDGMDVGFNPDTTVDPGESTTYRWFAEQFGTHFFLDGANQAVDSADEPPQVANLNSRGLFGAMTVYPQGTEWSDPYTGKRDHVTRDEIARAKYGERFSALSVETTGQVQAIFDRQSVSDWSSLKDVLTREEIAEKRYGVTVDEADLADALSREQIIEVQNEYDEQFGDLPGDHEFSRDDIARAKYDRSFSALSVETTGQVQAIFNRQPFPGETTPDEVLTREEIARDRFGKHYFALGSPDRRIEVENAYDAQFRPGNRSKRIRVQGRVQVDVHVPDDIPEEAVEAGFVPGVSFRDFKVYYHTPEGIQTRDGDELTFPGSDEPQSVHAINNRADPTGSRIDPDRCAACGGTEFYNSWIHGDPGGGDSVYPMYTGDPVKVIAIGASIEENHVHHLHGHRWKETPPNDGSDTIDSQTVGMGAVYEAPLVPAAGTPRAGIEDFATVRPDMEFEDAFRVGAGGAHRAAGDHLFHCHLFPHYGEGMWGIMRILDKENPGLQKLPNNDPPIPADSEILGYPDFIPGEFEQGPPFPPYGAAGLDDYRDPTPEEEQALTRNGEILPGAPYTDPADPQLEGFESAYEGETREYTIVALPADVVYNDDGHHDPEGRVYVLEEDAEKVRNGEMNPEPLVIRANVGDTVEITLKNEIEEDVISVPTVGGPDLGGGKSNHIHFVSYDVLGSDSLATGFNYNQQSLPDRPLPSRWYADEEGTIFFHDHITGIENIMNGTFCALIVEPPESEWLDPHTGEPIRSGTQAIIQNPNGDDFREFGLAYQDFAQLRDRDGDFVNPDREHDTNAGVMAINYRNAPYYTREDADPAYVHSSFVHGDPPTPTLEAYENDPVRFRVWQAAYEEQHNFGLHGRDFESEGLNPEEAITEIIGTSEAFNLDLLPEAEQERIKGLTENPAGLPIRDYAYGSSVMDDLWDGMWGIHRVFGAEVDHLHPLPDRGAPDGKISEAALREMGHPAPFSDHDWSEVGHEAKLLYGDDDDDDRAFPPDKDARQNESIDGNPPPMAPSPGDPCPDDAPVRSFDVCAFQSTITYNDHGDQDPLGTIFALDQHVEDIVNGDRRTHPLTLWANQGDCIEVNLTNKLGEVFYQVDLVVGEPDERLGETPEDFYGEEGRLIRFAHGSTTDPLTRRGSGGPDTLAEQYAECIDSEHITIEDGTASVTFTVRKGCELELSLAGYRKPGAGFDRDVEQELFGATTETFGPGTHTLTLDVPDQREPRADNDHAHPETRTKEENLDVEWERSERISLHPTRIDENVLGSDGATMGFNWDQTVAPGETITYRWFAEEAIGSVLLWDHADIRSNRHHGAYGQILIEDPDVEFADDGTAEPIIQGLQWSGMLKASDGLDLREFALLFADAQYIVNPTTDVCVVPPGPEAEEEGGDPDAPCNRIPDDPEDQGYPAVSYRSEPFIRRFDDDPDQSKVYDSETHGDPATPLPQALLGDPVLFRVNKAADKARGLSFHLSEHQWNRLTEVEESANIGVDDRFSVGSSSRVDPFGGAGGLANADGDFIYQELKQRRRLEGGMWGIFRVRESLDDFQSGAQASLHTSNGDNPDGEGFEHLIQPLPEMAAEQRLMPEDRPGWTVARGDLTGDGTNDLLVGIPSSDIGGTEAGTAYVLFGRGDEPVTDLLDADIAFVGPEAGAHLGSDVAINGTSTTGDGEQERSTTGDGEQNRTGDGREQTFYQVDLVVGEPDERLGETPEDFYGEEGRLIRFAHGNTADPLTRRGSGGPDTLAEQYAECIDSEHITIEDGTASVTFTVRKGCELELSLAGYRKPGAGFDRDVEQELFGATTETFGPGTHTLTLDVPAEPSVTIGSETQSFTISMKDGFGAIADAGDGDTVDVSATVSADIDGEPAGAIIMEGELPDATPGDGRFTGSSLENATVTEIPPGEAPPGETPGEGPLDEAPGGVPPVTVAIDGGLADTITGNIGIVVHLGMNGSR